MTITTRSEKAVNVLTIDAEGLQKLLENGDVTSLGLVGQYLAQIDKHDGKLHAMIQTTPKHLLEATAKSLDQERAAGKIRGPLHGIPIIIKVSSALSVPWIYFDLS
jgi:amidase